MLREIQAKTGTSNPPAGCELFAGLLTGLVLVTHGMNTLRGFTQATRMCAIHG